MATPRVRAAIGDRIRAAAADRRITISRRNLAALADAAASAVVDNTRTVHRPGGDALTPKPRATAADARAIARRIETTWSQT